MNKRFFQISIFLATGLALGKVYPLIFQKSEFSNFSQTQTRKEETKTEPIKTPETKPRQKTEKSGFIQCAIRGAVKNPGTYTLPRHARLQDLIAAAGGFTEGAYTEIKNYYLKNGTEFTIKYKNHIRVEIQGAVKNPGMYQMFSGQKLQDLIQKAGGLTESGILPEKNYYLKDGTRFYIMGRKKTKERIYE